MATVLPKPPVKMPRVVPKSPPPKAMPAEIRGQDVKPFPTPDEGDGEDGGDDGHESECGFPSRMKPWRTCSIPSQKTGSG